MPAVVQAISPGYSSTTSEMGLMQLIVDAMRQAVADEQKRRPPTTLPMAAVTT